MGGCARRDQSGVQAESQAFSRGENCSLETIIRPLDAFDEWVVQLTQPEVRQRSLVAFPAAGL